MFRSVCFRLCCLIITVTSFAFPQSDPFLKYVSHQWTMDDGLPQSSVNDIIQTRDGYLWLATFGGLVRYNGATFTVFDRSNSDGMKSDRVLNLYEDRSGAIWCSTEEGFVRFFQGKCTTFFIKDDGIIYSPLMVKEDARGVLWISVHAKPYRFSNGAFIRVTPINDSLLAATAVNDRRGIWMAHGRELLRTIGDSIVMVKDFSDQMQFNIQVGTEYPEGSGNYWMATSGDGVIRYANGAVQRYTELHGLPSQYMKRMYVDRTNTLWSIGFNGISRWTGAGFVPLHTVDGVEDKEFSMMIQDVEGNYWVGTPASGLFRLRPAVIRTIGPKDGLMEGKMLSLTMRRDSSLLFGTNCGGVYEWRNGRASYSAMNKHLINLCVWSLLEDSKGRIWAGSRQLSRFDDMTKRGIVYDSSNGFNGLDIFALFEDSKGFLWIGCLNGLFRFDGKHFTQFTTTDGLPHLDVRAIYQDRAGTMWFGTANGVCRYDEGTFRSVSLDPSDTASVPLRSRYVRAIHQDAEGIMWFGTYGGGIIRLKEGQPTVITTKQGLFDNIVSHIVEDEQGSFWMGCNRGLFRVSKADLNSVADGMQGTFESSVYGTSDGMMNSETNGGFQPSIVTGHNGDLYVPTVQGVVVVSTRKVMRNTMPPPVVIERITTEAGKSLAGSEISLSYDSASVQVEYSALSYTDPKRVRFKYRLIGYDNDWIDAGARRTAYYTNIPPGTHTFQAIASNNDGVWNTVGASVPIIVRPPFWMTWWFRTLMVLIFLFSGPSIYYIRVTQLEREKKAQLQFAEQLIESQEQERRRIAADLHDGLGQQILIIKNRVELALKTVADADETADQLREIAESARSSLNDVRAISHGLRPVHLEQFGLRETLLNLCDQIGQVSTVECVYHIDEIDGIIPKEREINFYRIIQEGVNNILKHSGATQSSMMIRRTDEGLAASLWDNGKGFDTAGVHAGLGLTGIRERAKILGGVCEIKSAAGEGTTIQITIPIKKT